VTLVNRANALHRSRPGDNTAKRGATYRHDSMQFEAAIRSGARSREAARSYYNSHWTPALITDDAEVAKMGKGEASVRI